MKQLLLLTLMLFFNIFVFAQNNPNAKINLHGFAGIGRATIETNISAPTKFPALEIKIGVGISKPLNESLALSSRLAFGSRLKRKSDMSARHDGRFTILDEHASEQNHYFIEIPLLLQYNFSRAGLGLRAGGNFKQYLSSNSTNRPDMISGKCEFGIIGGAAYSLTDRINIGIEYHAGLTKIYKGGGTIDGRNYALTGRNHLAQLVFEISF